MVYTTRILQSARARVRPRPLLAGSIALCAARTSADWFHEVVVPSAELLCFPNGKTKFIRVDGSVGKEPGTGVVLIGAGVVACEALKRSQLGVCMTIIR
jgi:hypothetical protein